MALKTERYALIDWVYRKSTSALPNMGRAVWSFHSAHDDKTGFKLYNLANASEEFKVLIAGSFGTSPYSIVHEYRGEDPVGGHYLEIADEPDGSKEFIQGFHKVRSEG